MPRSSGVSPFKVAKENVALTPTLFYGPRLASSGRTGFHCTADEPSLAGAARPGSVSGQLRPVRRPGAGRWNYSMELFIQSINHPVGHTRLSSRQTPNHRPAPTPPRPGALLVPSLGVTRSHTGTHEPENIAHARRSPGMLGEVTTGNEKRNASAATHSSRGSMCSPSR